MNYMTLPVRRGTLFGDDASSSHSLFSGAARRGSIIGIQNGKEEFQKEERKAKEKLRFKTPKAFLLASRVRHLIAKRKYKDVDLFKVTLNVGGVRFVTYKGTLNNIHDTRLGKLNENCEEYDSVCNEYFFDRNPEFFQYILDYQRTGRMHIPRHFCPITIRDELVFWELDDYALSSCCRKQFYDALNEVIALESLEEDLRSVPKTLYDIVSETNVETNEWKEKLWEFLDDSSSSVFAKESNTFHLDPLKLKIWAYYYMLMVLISIASIFISTLPSCRDTESIIFKRRTSLSQKYPLRSFHGNLTANVSAQTIWPSSDATQFLKEEAKRNRKIEILLTTQPHDALIIIDLVCMFFFTIEFMVRLSVCPQKKRLIKSVSTVFDLLYLLPVWLIFCIDLFDSKFWDNQDRITFLLLIQALMVFRVLRIFRLFRHYRGLKILWLAIRSSINELFLLYAFVLFSITIFASFIYCAEIFNDQAYDNILVGSWWALITMTTVGYGDMYPSTWAGYVVAGVCALTGIIILGMTVPIIASNFHAYYGLRIPGDDDVVIRKKERKTDDSKKVDKESKIGKADVGGESMLSRIVKEMREVEGSTPVNTKTTDKKEPDAGSTIASISREDCNDDSQKQFPISALPPPLFARAGNMPEIKKVAELKTVDEKSARRAGATKIIGGEGRQLDITSLSEAKSVPHLSITESKSTENDCISEIDLTKINL